MKKKSAVLLGTAIGDALGAQFETQNWNSPSILNWNGLYGPSDFHKISGGNTTDDTAMSLALAEALVENNGFNPEKVAKKYLDWYAGPNFVGAGKTTTKALDALKHGVPWWESGELNALGNGTAMRSSPLGVYYNDEPTKLIKFAKLDATITHDSYEAKQGSIAMAMGVYLLLSGVKKEEILESIKRVLGQGRVLDNLCAINNNKLIRDTLKNKEYDSSLDKNGGNRVISQLILGSGYTCIEVVARAFYCFIATKSFKECMELGNRGGGDTDTCLALAGALCGAYYGIDGIDKYYIDNLVNNKYIIELDERLAQ